MNFEFPVELFGTSESEDFIDEPECRPKFDEEKSTLVWESPLNGCNITSHITERYQRPEYFNLLIYLFKCSGKIIFTKTLCISPNLIQTENFSLAVVGSKSGTAVKFSCEYEPIVLVHTNTVNVGPGMNNTLQFGKQPEIKCSFISRRSSYWRDGKRIVRCPSFFKVLRGFRFDDTFESK